MTYCATMSSIGYWDPDTPTAAKTANAANTTDRFSTMLSFVFLAVVSKLTSYPSRRYSRCG